MYLGNDRAIGTSLRQDCVSTSEFPASPANGKPLCDQQSWNHDGITSECSGPMLKSDIAGDDDRAALVAKSVIILGATEITLLTVAQSVCLAFTQAVLIRDFSHQSESRAVRITVPPSTALSPVPLSSFGDRAQINIEQFGNLSLTLRAQSNHFDGLGLLGRGEFIPATTPSEL